MPTPDRSDYVTLQYDAPKGIDEHLRQSFTVHTVRFGTGEQVRVHPEFATIAIQSAPTPDCMTVVDGTPKPVTMESPTDVAERKRLNERMGPSILGRDAEVVPPAPPKPAAAKLRDA